MVKLPLNGTLLIHTMNALYTLVIIDEVGMALQGHEEYCPIFTQISKVEIQPGRSMLFTMLPKEGETSGKTVITSTVREVHLLSNWVHDDAVGEFVQSFVQHEDQGDVCYVRQPRKAQVASVRQEHREL